MRPATEQEERAVEFRSLFDDERRFRAWYEAALPTVYDLDGEKMRLVLPARGGGRSAARARRDHRSTDPVSALAKA